MFHIDKQHYDAMIAHVRSEYPNEGCGLVAGQAGKIGRIYKTTNVDPNPRVRYQIDPKELLEVFRELDRQGLELIGIFHSHPQTQAYPSPTDISLAFYPDSYYFIISLRNVEQPELRAFRIVDGKIQEEPVQILE